MEIRIDCHYAKKLFNVRRIKNAGSLERVSGKIVGINSFIQLPKIFTVQDENVHHINMGNREISLSTTFYSSSINIPTPQLPPYPNS